MGDLKNRAFLGVPPFLSIFTFVTEKLAIFYVPARTSQDQLAGSWSQYLTSPQPRDPIIMIIIDSTHHHLSIIIIIIGGRGCGLVRYCDHERASRSWLVLAGTQEITSFLLKQQKAQKWAFPPKKSRFFASPHGDVDP